MELLINYYELFHDILIVWKGSVYLEMSPDTKWYVWVSIWQEEFLGET